MDLVAIMVVYKNGDWLKVGPYSFKEHYPDVPLILINNSVECDTELLVKVAKDLNVEIVDNVEYKPSHGGGLACGVKIAKQKKYRYMMIIEADCLFFEGETNLKVSLKELKQSKAWVTYVLPTVNGLPHPVGSVWDLKFIDEKKDASSWELPPKSAKERQESGIVVKMTDPWFYSHFDPSHKLFWRAIKASQCKRVHSGKGKGLKHFWRNEHSRVGRTKDETPQTAIERMERWGPEMYGILAKVKEHMEQNAVDHPKEKP